ncbi:hypothetical protein ACFRIC_30655 [Streptomyces sp. NPDC056738]|uniref:hypothetical protein n=1 Tax=Streptomyces sp. NPDC056738 TaxID=3345933 RepID=UPI0036A1B453
MTETLPGEWPVDEPVDLVPEDLYVKRAAERGRHEIVLGSIRAHLEEQPSPVAVLTAVRQWINEVIALGDEVTREKRKAA